MWRKMLYAVSSVAALLVLVAVCPFCNKRCSNQQGLNSHCIQKHGVLPEPVLPQAAVPNSSGTEPTPPAPAPLPAAPLPVEEAAGTYSAAAASAANERGLMSRLLGSWTTSWSSARQSPPPLPADTVENRLLAVLAPHLSEAALNKFF